MHMNSSNSFIHLVQYFIAMSSFFNSTLKSDGNLNVSLILFRRSLSTNLKSNLDLTDNNLISPLIIIMFTPIKSLLAS